MWMKKRRNFTGITNKNNNKMRVLQVVQDKINKNKDLKKRWDVESKKKEKKGSEKGEEKK